jgi:hypothetical protein
MVNNSSNVLSLHAFSTEHATPRSISDAEEQNLRERPYACQLSTVCHCGKAKPGDAYVCADCWEHVPADLKARLGVLESVRAELRALIHRIDQIARFRNPDRLEILTASEEVGKAAAQNEATPANPKAAPDVRQLLREHFGQRRFQMVLIEQEEHLEQTQ